MPMGLTFDQMRDPEALSQKAKEHRALNQKQFASVPAAQPTATQSATQGEQLSLPGMEEKPRAKPSTKPRAKSSNKRRYDSRQVAAAIRAGQAASLEYERKAAEIRRLRDAREGGT